MTVFKKTKRNLKRLFSNEAGSMAVAWALSIGTMIAVIAAAMDLAMLHNADSRSQSIADTTALAAAIFVKNHERIPNSREEGLLGEYTADELGYEFRGWVEGGATGVKINIAYNDVDREAIVTVTGNTRPTILQVVSSDLKFHSKSTVKYHDTDFADPASVVLVLDNSGSMDFDDIPIDEDGNRPADAQPRIDGLESSAKELMTMLENVAGPQDPDGPKPAVLRTGMMAFSGSNAPGQENISIDQTVPMAWGVISDAQIDAMDPEGATNSAPPLKEANTWLNINEPPIHKLETPHKTPLKFIIMMTDGQNTVGDDEWVAREGTEQWRRYVTGRSTPDGLDQDTVTSQTTEISPAECGVPDPNSNRWEWFCHYSQNGNNWTRIIKSFRNDPGPASGNSNAYPGAIYNCSGRRVTMCVDAETKTTYSGFEYDEGENEPPLGSDGPWEEGEFDIESNIDTRAECDDLHAKGVEIYTIAYALAPGDYRTNDWGVDNNKPGGADYLFPTTAENAVKARGVLQYCASDDDNFITADDTASLSTAFERIGNDIIQEIIRISG